MESKRSGGGPGLAAVDWINDRQTAVGVAGVAVLLVAILVGVVVSAQARQRAAAQHAMEDWESGVKLVRSGSVVEGFHLLDGTRTALGGTSEAMGDRLIRQGQEELGPLAEAIKSDAPMPADAEESLRRLERLFQAAELFGDARGLELRAQCLHWRGRLAKRLGEFARAGALYGEVEVLCREVVRASERAARLDKVQEYGRLADEAAALAAKYGGRGS